MTSYRRFLVTFKESLNGESVHSRKSRRERKTWKLWRKRVARSHLHYFGYLSAYLKAKRAVFAGEECVDA
jgi:hypothetical protein